MGTGQRVKKSHTPRKFSQSSLRTLTKPKLEDIFEVTEPITELDEETKLMEELSRKAIEEEDDRQKALNHNFIAGRRYYIEKTPAFESDYIFEYIKKEGKHHMFREIHGGWSITYTDPQLIGKTIKEVV